MKKSVYLNITAITVAFAVPAHGQDTRPDAHVMVRDLDLSRAEGVRTMDRRIGAAIASVCGNGGEEDLATRIERMRCSRGKLAEVAHQRQRLLAQAGNSPVLLAARQ